MPRLCIEYTSNIKPYVDLENFLDELTEAIAKVPSINRSLIKSRLWCPEVAKTGTQGLSVAQEEGYIFVFFEWLEGREEVIQKQVFDVLRFYLKRIKESLEGRIACSITYEVREIPRRSHETI